MQNNDIYLDINNLRLEIAILQEDINSQNPGIHKFIIPAIMTGEKVGTMYVHAKNSANKIIEAFVGSQFLFGRHLRRLNKLSVIEKFERK